MHLVPWRGTWRHWKEKMEKSCESETNCTTQQSGLTNILSWLLLICCWHTEMRVTGKNGLATFSETSMKWPSVWSSLTSNEGRQNAVQVKTLKICFISFHFTSRGMCDKEIMNMRKNFEKEIIRYFNLRIEFEIRCVFQVLESVWVSIIMMNVDFLGKFRTQKILKK